MQKLASMLIAAAALALLLVAMAPDAADAGRLRPGYRGHGPIIYGGPIWRGYGWAYGRPYSYRYKPYAYYPYWRGGYWRR